MLSKAASCRPRNVQDADFAQFSTTDTLVNCQLFVSVCLLLNAPRMSQPIGFPRPLLPVPVRLPHRDGGCMGKVERRAFLSGPGGSFKRKWCFSRDKRCLCNCWHQSAMTKRGSGSGWFYCMS
ncbi:hypothetical protein FOCG_06545 [Fusarium oxysporum f. sp. radicis-lycopersici 26381]|uniref:Uncharacterized protein n=1 Tax=Fusarium oxysporum Fo47 TaxID=660027 RepID=W9L0L3_FUSOX|nr:hypothetical protein FOZG_03605 [Fusarium oxysporum Fo47]EWZ92884.1 hypothetical protein FOWG_05844 [Fusarium oxysporum f. sp. lycopersici MN25]EXL53165.1 hypothetical protein FOCG_06545 [Fusarium oxysporum f. sp. radicis-lycopersici 26381]